MDEGINSEAHLENAGSAPELATTRKISAFPAPIYRETVLTQVFEDAKRFFLGPLLEIQFAHTLMLAKQGIMPEREAAQCLRALQALDLEEVRNTPYDGKFEDLFFLVEHRLAEICGRSVAGKMHIARSRNDIGLTIYRMVLRDRVIEVARSLIELRELLVNLAREHRASLMTAYTHNQPAQPTTLGHYLMAMIECFERDMERLQAAYERVNRSPMGACAITTTSFPIDREYTAELLGFDRLQTNSYGAIAAVDYLTEACSVIAVSMLNLGRFAQDLLQWSTVEFGYLRLSEGYVQISSIMPQKRNPVPLEHVRILASRAMTQAQAAIGSLHNTPFADMNDGEDDLQPLVYTLFDDAIRSLQLMTGLLSETEFKTDQMAAKADAGFLTVTELADTLVRATSMDFRTAHEIVATSVKELAGNYNREKMAAAVEHNLAMHTPSFQVDGALLRTALTASNFVAVRKIAGGPAEEVLNPEISRAGEQCRWDRKWLDARVTRLQSARQLQQLKCSRLIEGSAEVS
jgi:argininosuccinate lyase